MKKFSLSIGLFVVGSAISFNVSAQFGDISAIVRQSEVKRKLSEVARIERDSHKTLVADAPKSAPIVDWNTGNSTSQLRPADIPPVSLSKTIQNLSKDQRVQLATVIRSDIARLNDDLNNLLSIDEKSQEVLKTIDELNKSISAKREAFDFTIGNQTDVSNAAAESFAATGNPFFLICGNSMWAKQDPLRWMDMLTPQRETLIEAGRSVGLLTVDDRPAGTAFVVGKSHVITNLHVARLIADYDDSKKTWKIREGAKIKFDVESSLGADLGCPTAPESRTYYVNGVFSTPSDMKDDLAILITSTDPRFPKPLTVKNRPAKQYAGNLVVALIGYPGPPSDMTAAEQIQFFSTPESLSPQYPFKRLSGGFTGNKIVTTDGVFIHRANTSGGNSGSPIFDINNGEVVGIHVAGTERFSDILGYNHGIVAERILRLLTKSGL